VTTYGVTAQGFVSKTVEILRGEIRDAWRAQFGASADVDPQTPDGQIIDIMAERFAELWEQAEGIYAAFDPDQAVGAAQDALAALTGTVRLPATSSSVTETLTGDNATVVPAGKVVSVEVTGSRFVTIAPGTLATVNDYAALANGGAVVLGARYWVADGGTDRVYQCSQGGNVANPKVPPTGIAAGQIDGTVHWDYVGDGKAAVDVLVQAESTGPVIAVARTLTVIETPVTGWKGARNALDAKLGTNLETDAGLRVRRELEIRATGNAAVDAIRADVLHVGEGTNDPVVAATVFPNDTDLVDVDGRPPHSVEVLVQGGADADVAKAVFNTVGGGIATYGTTTVSVTDDQGVAHAVRFSRPSEQDVYVTVNLKYDDKLYFPSTSDDLVKAAIVAYGDLQPTGKDVVASALSAQAFKVPGVLDVSSLFIGLAPSPVSSATIPISLRQLAVFDTSRIVVVSTPAIP
jgi:uncharacterized phage protein gp47/JayE